MKVKIPTLRGKRTIKVETVFSFPRFLEGVSRGSLYFRRFIKVRRQKDAEVSTTDPELGAGGGASG